MKEARRRKLYELTVAHKVKAEETCKLLKANFAITQAEHTLAKEEQESILDTLEILRRAITKVDERIAGYTEEIKKLSAEID